VEALFPNDPNDEEEDGNPEGGKPPTSTNSGDWAAAGAGQLRKVISRTKSDAGLGVIGWAPSLLKLVCRPIVHHSNKGQTIKKATPFTKATVKYMQMWLAGTAPLVQLTMVSQLLPLDKNKPGSTSTTPGLQVRPICIGSLLERCMSRTMKALISTTDALMPEQLGVSSKGGVEAIVHRLHGRIRELEKMSENDRKKQGKRNIHMLDFKDACNTINTKALLQGCRKHCPDLVQLAHQTLGNGPRWVSMGETIISTKQGVPQEWVFEPLLFSIGIRDTLEAFKERILALDKEAWLLAYLDDVNGETDLTRQALLEIWKEVLQEQEEQPNAAPIGMELNTSKTKCVSLEAIARTGVELLGAQVGPLEATVAFIRGKLEEHRRKLAELETVDWDSALRIFDVCVNHELTFIMRTTDPAQAWKECIINEREALEEERQDFYLRKAGMTTQDLTAQGRLALHLPKRLGGAGRHGAPGDHSAGGS